MTTQVQSITLIPTWVSVSICLPLPHTLQMCKWNQCSIFYHVDHDVERIIMFFTSFTERLHFAAIARGVYFYFCRFFYCSTFQPDFCNISTPNFVFVKLFYCELLSKMTKDMDKTKIIKSILNIRCREGATIADIESKSCYFWAVKLFADFPIFFPKKRRLWTNDWRTTDGLVRLLE